MDYTQHFDSPLGGITLACDGEALIGLWFDGQKHFGAALKPEHAEKRMPVLEEAERWLLIYFSGEAPDFTPPLSLRGTAFQKQVWEALLTVPYGGTATYAEIASRAAKRAGTGACARAAGSAIARNPVSLIVPCHRVVGADGSLTGYAGGVRRKQALLSLERAPKILLPSGAVCGTLLENQPREVHLPCACAGPAKT
ncbi:MAG: methylated-DNA--[Clostridia bacterium]|nr:methylated-DNA--[protein]-cysteine S-methyltransferase [Clostridia bacterium]